MCVVFCVALPADLAEQTSTVAMSSQATYTARGLRQPRPPAPRPGADRFDPSNAGLVVVLLLLQKRLVYKDVHTRKINVHS